MVSTMQDQYQLSPRILIGSLATLVFLSINTSLALAQSQSSSEKSPDQWNFTLAPYLIVPWMDGKTAVRGQEADVNVKPSQIFDNLQFGAMGCGCWTPPPVRRVK